MDKVWYTQKCSPRFAARTPKATAQNVSKVYTFFKTACKRNNRAIIVRA